MSLDVTDSGSFPAVHPVAALAMPMSRRRTGLLTLKRGPLRRDVAFREGQAIKTHSNSPLESLPMLLVSRKMIDKEQAVAVLKAAKQAKRDPGELLVEQELIPESTLPELRSWQAAFLIVSAGGWPEGEYRFRDVAEPKLPGPEVAIGLPTLLQQALQRGGQDPTGQLDDMMGRTLRLSPAPPFELSTLATGPGEQELLDRIDGNRTVEAVVTDPPCPPGRALALVWLLLVTGAAVTTGSMMARLRGRMGDAGRRKATSYVGGGQQEVIALGPDIAKVRDEPSVSTPIAPPVADEPSIGGAGGEEASLGAAAAADELGKTGEVDDEVRELKSRLTDLGSSLFGDGFTTDVSASDLQRKLLAAAEEEEDALQLDDEAVAGLDEEQRARLAELQAQLEAMGTQNYLEIFGLDLEAESTEIRAAYFEMAKRYHPDHFSHEPEPVCQVAQRIFAVLSEANDTLSDDARRQAYIDHKVLGKKTKEEEAMEQARAIMEAEAAYKIGLRLLNNGQLTEAHAQFERAYSGYPDEDDYRSYYSYTHWRLKQKASPEEAEESEQALRTAVQNRPKNPVPLHLLGKVVMIKGDAKFARELFKRVVRLQPSNAEALTDLKKADAAVREAERKSQSTFGRLFGRNKEG